VKFLWRRMTAGDRVLAGGLLLAALAGIAVVTAAPPGQRVVVSDGERVLYTAPLDQPCQADIAGPLGSTRLVIDQAGARIAASPCVGKVCLGMGPARRPGDLLVCLPNRILVQVEGEPSNAAVYDLLSR
jgi:hypothetical protein